MAMDLHGILNQKGDSPLHIKLLEEFQSIKAHKKAIQANIDELNTLIKQLEAKPKDSSYDEEMQDMKGEVAALGRIVKDINEKSTFEFMSDQGLLPNYAFPEAGIVGYMPLAKQSMECGNRDRHWGTCVYILCCPWMTGIKKWMLRSVCLQF